MMAESRNDGTKEEAIIALQWHSKRYFMQYKPRRRKWEVGEKVHNEEICNLYML
jgi:hypothetical protein